MFTNKNYEWMMKWDENDFHLIESLYWYNLYNKIMNQGTTSDKARLMEWYDKGLARSGKVGSFGYCLAVLFNFTDNYRYACCNFINEMRMANLDDNIERKNRIKAAERQRQREEEERKQNTYTYNGVEVDALAMEEQLNASHTEEQKRREYVNGINDVHPTYDESVAQKVLYSGSKNVYHRGRYIPINYVVYDMAKGFYTAFVWSEVRGVTAEGKQKIIAAYNPWYADHQSKNVSGILTSLKYLIQEEEMNIIMKGFRNEEPTPRQSRVRAQKNTRSKVNFDRINRALQNNDNDDLESDIF